MAKEMKEVKTPLFFEMETKENKESEAVKIKFNRQATLDLARKLDKDGEFVLAGFKIALLQPLIRSTLNLGFETAEEILTALDRKKIPGIKACQQ